MPELACVSIDTINTVLAGAKIRLAAKVVVL